MNELLFTLLSFSPGPFWLILAFAPKHKLAMRAFDIYLILLSTVFAMLTILGDLWIGRWVTHDSLQNNVSWFIRLPILLVILFFGPVGLFFYFASRILFLKKLWLYSDN